MIGSIKENTFKVKYKNGNVEIILVLVLILTMITIFSVIYILSIQINSYIFPVKQDLFYIVQNAYLSMDNSDLSYNKYTINNEELFSKVSYILEKNHKEVKLDTLQYDKHLNQVEIIVSLKLKPVVLSGVIKDINFKIKDNIKIKMMEVNT